MKKIINPQMTLMALGILQPATAQEVRGFLTTAFSEGGELPVVGEFSVFLEKQVYEGRVLKISERDGGYFVLTAACAQYLPLAMRRTRDKFRMYLLRDARHARFILSRGDSDEELAGAAPAVDTSSDVKGRAANKLGRRQASGRPYWPRIQRQFARKTGLSRSPRDAFPPLLSFGEPSQVTAAGHKAFKLDYFGIGLCLGVSPQLIWRMTVDSDRYYRSFQIRKKAGGKRRIDSPRVFLKVVQSFLADYVLDRLPIHSSVHSFAIGRSIVSNSANHVGKAFVGSIDIENFFGSITTESVEELLLRYGFHPAEAEAISKLSTKGGKLPQGAPTSPIISNAYLYEFDVVASKYCASRNLAYSRYADDLTVSGNDRSAINKALLYLQSRLREMYGLELNENKTRVSGRGGQQRVAGVVVNEFAAPPRKFRRMVRAAFHNASENMDSYVDRISELGGYLGYLKIFPAIKVSSAVENYQSVLQGLKSRKRGRPAANHRQRGSRTRQRRR